MLGSLGVCLLCEIDTLTGWAQAVDMCLGGDVPSIEHNRVRIVDLLYHRMVPILSWDAPTSIAPVTVPNPLGGLLDAWPRASPAKVLGGTSADPVHLRYWLSIEPCASANARIGPNGRNVLRPIPAPVLVSLL